MKQIAAVILFTLTTVAPRAAPSHPAPSAEPASSPTSRAVEPPAATRPAPTASAPRSVAPKAPADAPPARRALARSRWAGRTYALSAWREIPLLLIPGAMAVGWVFQSERAVAHCAPLCDKAEVNGFDRTVAGNYSTAWRLVSDLSVAGSFLSGLIALFAEEGFFAGLNDLVVIAESVIWANAWCVIGNMAARRARPYLYSEDAPLDERNSGHASLSFLSGHVGAVSALTTSLFVTFRRRDPRGSLQWWALGVGAALTAAAAVSRTQAGDHFPTDVLLGAAVGASMGMLIPYLHGSPVRLAPAVGRGRAALMVSSNL